MKMTVLPLHATPKETSQDLVQDNIDDEESKCGEYMWSEDGPPRHWATSKKALKGMKNVAVLRSSFALLPS